MSITDELRKYTEKQVKWLDVSKVHYRKLFSIADRIDAEHEGELLETGNNILRDVRREWVRLPKDADGKYIHVGDEMCGYGWPNGGVYCRAIVNEVTILVGPQDGAYRGWLMWAANECRHYHAPTVEDVLTEFGIDWEHESDCEDRAALLKEYAAKLRLAEEDA